MPERGAAYELVVRGRIGPRLVAALAPFEVVEATDERTRLRGWLPDQSALHGTLRTVSDLGIELLAVKRAGLDA